ncbi:hypothetical protein Lser_V15G24920 [Lactuca serriola]
MCEVRNCKKLVSLGKKKNKMESMKEVKFYNCDRLQSYNCPMSVERLAINYCRSITSLNFSTVLISERIPEKDFGISPLSCLRSLEIFDLKTLVIGCLNKPMAEWGMQNFPSSLVAMHLKGKNSGVVSFRVAEDARNTTASSSFILPASLASLTLQDFMDVESLSDVLQHLPCLKCLEIWSWPKLKDTNFLQFSSR